MLDDMVRSYFITLSVFLIALFPMIGNAIAYPGMWYRRAVQLSVLFICLIIYFLLRNPKQIFTAIRKFYHTKFTFKFISLPLFVILIALINIARNNQIHLYEVSILVFTVFIGLIISIIFIDHHSKISKKIIFLSQTDQNLANHFKFRDIILYSLSVIGLVISFIAWWHGPVRNEFIFEFRGSVIVLSLCSTIGLFTIMFSTSFWKGILLSLPYAYLNFITTSRTGILVLISMFAFYAILKYWNENRGIWNNFFRVTSTFFASISIIFSIVVLPAFSSSRWYPYKVDFDKKYLVEVRVDELYKRYGRLFRAFHSTGLLDVTKIASVLKSFRSNANKIESQLTLKKRISEDTLTALNKNDKEIENKIELKEENLSFLMSNFEKKSTEFLLDNNRIEYLLNANTTQEGRLPLLKNSVSLVLKSPWLGYWPKPYSQLINTKCSANDACKYPHNIVLDLAYNFGLFVSLTLVLGTLYLVYILCMYLKSKNTNILMNAIASGTIVYLLGSLFTGTFYDLFTAMILLTIWFIELQIMDFGIGHSPNFDESLNKIN